MRRQRGTAVDLIDAERITDGAGVGGAGLAGEVETEVVFVMPPRKRYAVELKITRVRRGKPCFLDLEEPLPNLGWRLAAFEDRERGRSVTSQLLPPEGGGLSLAMPRRLAD